MMDIGRYFATHGGDASLFMFLWKGEQLDDPTIQLSEQLPNELSESVSDETDRPKQLNNMGTGS